jgi:hypothetical protein
MVNEIGTRTMTAIVEVAMPAATTAFGLLPGDRGMRIIVMTRDLREGVNSFNYLAGNKPESPHLRAGATGIQLRRGMQEGKSPNRRGVIPPVEFGADLPIPADTARRARYLQGSTHAIGGWVLLAWTEAAPIVVPESAFCVVPSSITNALEAKGRLPC